MIPHAIYNRKFRSLFNGVQKERLWVALTLGAIFLIPKRDAGARQLHQDTIIYSFLQLFDIWF